MIISPLDPKVPAVQAPEKIGVIGRKRKAGIEKEMLHS